MSRGKVATRIARVAEKRRLRNSAVKSRMKTAIGKTEKVIASGDMELAQKEMIKVVSSIDRAVSKGVIHRNRGARLKSQLTRESNQAILKEKGG